ncbi:glycine zipper domain-containing protein [Azospirillum sp. TSO22-1]|uniref:glycine zipper domain-containing protein n=1 Tax=Azospirillum sp. TSO22-1 TaxID=716789 RepID=UPI001304944F|nr:glycine zipper domain-containing protein [Azospirillum sp. TSO22-1]
MKIVPAVVLATALCLSGFSLAGCQTNQQTGALVGTAGGSAVGALLGKSLGHSGGATLIGGLAGGAAGYFIGSSIGQSLDERDRMRAQTATAAALNAPLPVKASSPSAAPRPVPAAQRPSKTWTSDHKTGAKGSATVTAVEAASDGRECRTVHEVAYVQGREVTQDTKYCRNAQNQWQPA